MGKHGDSQQAATESKDTKSITPGNRPTEQELLDFCRMLFEHGRECEQQDSSNWPITETFQPYQDLRKLVSEAKADVHRWYISQAHKVAMVNETDLQKTVTLESIVIAAKDNLRQLGVNDLAL